MLIQTIYLFIMALILALIEIQIEGKNGWASQLPTWRPSEGSKVDKVFRKIMAGKQTTGYHILVFAFVMLIMHYPFFAGLKWTWVDELRNLSLFFSFSAVWDFLWIVANPHYGVKKMGIDHIWWHSKRWKGIPQDYFNALGVSFMLYLPLIFKNIAYLKEWFMILFVFCALTLVVVLLTPEERERWKNEK